MNLASISLSAFLLANLVSMPSVLARSDSLLFCANDQTVTYATREMIFLENPRLGSISLIDLDATPPAASTIQSIPCSVIGPPTSIARVPNRPMIVVTCAMRSQKINNRWQHIPNRKVSLLSFDSTQKLELLDQIEVGLQPTGLSFHPDGKHAYIANRADGTVSLIRVDQRTLKEVTRFKIAKPTDSLAHIELSPDGRHALATLQQAGETILLEIQDNLALRIVQRIPSGPSPYSVRINRDGKWAVIADVSANTLTLLDLQGSPATITQQIQVGNLPEGIDISPDGEWIVVNCMEGANIANKEHPLYGQPARLYLIKRNNAGEIRVHSSQTTTGAPQFALFTPDGRKLVVSHTRLRTLSTLTFNNGQLTDTGHRIPVDGEPVAACR
ncbi:MAG: hypothetical protein B9S32_00885 [Verrucomicrobia bacterium Tous-C9LFEB]|nr:MAG: hypothetical protein B9S32_00885 [Verrucomicrobia bacterium Tous-C9LFEB]